MNDDRGRTLAQMRDHIQDYFSLTIPTSAQPPALDTGAASGRATLRSIAGFGLTALILAAAAWWLFLRAPLVTAVPVQIGDAAEVVYATGVVEPEHWAKVTAMQRKRIVEICSCEGQAVAAGDVLARLDDREERAVLTELEARLERLREDADRLDTLVQRNSVSRVTLDKKLTQVREHEARILAQKQRLSEFVLRAPIDGIVLRRDGEVGEIAGTGPNDTLFWVGQRKPLRVAAEINEDDILRVKPGQAVLLRHEGHATAEPLDARVDRITPKGDPSTKTFRAYLALPADTPLQIGMSVEANIVVREVQGAMLVPSEAVADGSVMAVRNGKASRIPVEAGIQGANAVEVRGQIAAGELVVSPAVPGLVDGQAVRVAPALRP